MKFKTLLPALALGASACSFAQTIISESGYGSGILAYAYNGGSQQVSRKGVLLNLPNTSSLLKINLPSGSNWSGYTHLQIVVQNMGRSPEPFHFAVQSTGMWCFTEIILMPEAESRILMPLDNGTTLGLGRPAQPPAASSFQVFSGYSVDKPNVQWLMVNSPNQSGSTALLIKEMRPVNTPVPKDGIVDQYGQQALVSWPAKVRSDADLTNLLAGHPISGNYPFSADIYGGVNGTAQPGSATGRWHTEKQNGKWYIINPLGNRFFSAGVVAAGNASPGIVTGRENAFATGALPSRTGPFAEHYSDLFHPFGGAPLTNYNFYFSNQQRKYGADWRNQLTNTTSARMRTWGYNTAGPSSWEGVKATSTQISFTDVTIISGAYATMWDPVTYRQVPDVFDPLWAQTVLANLTPMVASLANRPNNMGLYVDNEVPFAKPWSYQNARYGLTEVILNSPATQPTKINFVTWLKQRYSNNVASFNSSWGTTLPSIDTVLTSQVPIPQVVPTGMARDLQDYILVFARKYYSTIREKLNSLNYKGLYLGSRFLYFTPEVLQACKEYCDVVTFNGYEHKPTDHHEEIKALDAPVMISEIGIGASDMGRTPWFPNLLTENDRALYFKRYLDDAATWPNMVGIHWYKWEDDPVSGRYYDGDNSCVGIVSITDIPYWPTVATATSSNTFFHQRLVNP